MNDFVARSWGAHFQALPDAVRTAIYNEARCACPECGLKQVPQSWAVVTYETAVPALLALINELTDKDPCRYDHDGLCQEHYYERPCANERALALLKGQL